MNLRDATWTDLIGLLIIERSSHASMLETEGSVATPAFREALRRANIYSQFNQARFPDEALDDAVQGVMERLMDVAFLKELHSRPMGPGYFIKWVRNSLAHAERARRLAPEGSGAELLAPDQGLSLHEAARLEGVKVAIQKLSPAERSLLFERYVGFDSLRDFAASKGEPYARVAKRVNRAISHLREILAEDT